MTAIKKEEAIAGTLAWCNEVREAKGMQALERLPQGLRNDGNSCPCGEATKTWVGFAYVRDEVLQEDRRVLVSREGGIDTPVPDEVLTFVLLFDSGDIPEYDKEMVRA